MRTRRSTPWSARLRTLVATAMFGAAVGFAASCGGEEPARAPTQVVQAPAQVQPTAAPQPTATPTPKPTATPTPKPTATPDPNAGLPSVFKIGLIPGEASEEVLKRYQPIVPWLSEQLGVKVELFVGPDYSATIEAMKSHRIDAAFMNTFGYVIAVDQKAAELVTVPMDPATGEPAHYHSTIIVRKDSGIKTVADVKGKNFAFVDPASTSGHLYPESGLKKLGIDPWKQYKSVYSGGHDVSVLSVYNRTVDAAAVYASWDENNPLNGGIVDNVAAKGVVKKDELAVIWVSDPIPNGATIVHPKTHPVLKERLRNAMLSVPKYPDIAAAFGKEYGSAYTIGSDDLFDAVRDAATYLKLDLAKLIVSDKRPIPEVVKIGLIPSEDSESILARYKPLVPWMEKSLGAKVELFVGTDYSATIEALKSGRIHAAFLNSFGYILAADQGSIELVVVPEDPVTGDYGHYHSVILTRKDSGINSLNDLKGKNFGFVDPASTSGHLIPEAGLKKMGIDPWKDFKSVYSGGHDVSLLAVYNGTLNAAANASGADENDPLNYDRLNTMDAKGQVKKNELKALWVSDPIPSGPFVVQKNAPQKLKDKLLVMMLSVRDNEEIRKLLGRNYTVGSDDLWNPLREAAKMLGLDLRQLVNN